MNDKKSYNIGLDIGTSSVGWAVIDDDFNVIRKGNKRTPLWGVRLFDEADTAASRRMFRSTRRRFDRRRERIKLLQDIFYKYAIYNNIKIVLIDSQSYGIKLEYENKLIIDENLDEFVL